MASQPFNTLYVCGAPPESCADLVVVGAHLAPAEHAALEWSQYLTTGTSFGGASRKCGDIDDPVDHLRASPEATGDLVGGNAIVDKLNHATL